MAINGIMMQYFEWDLEADASLWTRVKEKAKDLAAAGVSALWLPPAYKGFYGVDDSGYGVYDIYDLGEFPRRELEDSTETDVRTKYGTKQEYLDAISACHKEGIQVYADTVLNHMTGAGTTERVNAVIWKRNSGSEPWYSTNEMTQIDAWTNFHFLGRAGKYSTFKWNKDCFDGVDTDGTKYDPNTIYLFEGKEWDPNTNFDFLNCSDVDAQSAAVREELEKWGVWYLNTTGVDGFRLDALKHVSPEFYNEWLDRVGSEKEVFIVGEYFSSSARELEQYLGYITTDKVKMHLFDFALHEKFYQASTEMNYPINDLVEGETLVHRAPLNAVTFVDNHDTQVRIHVDNMSNPREVAAWFKPHAYAFILLREQGYPCVFYKDYNETSEKEGGLAATIGKMIRIRKQLAYGMQRDYSSRESEIGWTREATEEGSAVAVVLSKNDAQPMEMYVGIKEAGKTYVNAIGSELEVTRINEEGIGTFTVGLGTASVWVEKEAYETLFV